MSLHHLDFRLSYADCDPAGILYYAAWFPWMERVQTEWLYLNDLRQDTLQTRYGFHTITRAARCEYLVPVTLFTPIRISLSVTALGRTSFRRGLDMVRRDDEVLVAQGELALVTLDGDGTPIPVPPPLRPLLETSLTPR
ncbi:acyl-CoA thioesterase [Actinosynnema sp. NPDC020468]|uniref:acyl-CoA thioesterase n=1 Tax=Actinosynnema sp. NPDC020468 TaxID=3154488 RepID=UPI0033E0D7A6